MKSLSKLVVTAGLLAASAVCLVTGCEEPLPPPPPARHLPPPPPPTWPSETAQLGKLTPKLTDEIDALPGNTLEHRRLAAAAVKDLTRFLTLADGPVQTPAYADRMSVLQSAAEVLARQNVPRGRLIAVENQALHSTVLALADISKRYLFDDPDLARMVDAAKAKVNQIDGIDETNGVMHDLTAADAFEAIKPALVQIDQDLQDRFGTEDATPAETPAAGQNPVAPPVPVPAPETPATPPAVPATEPMKPAEPPKPAPDLTAPPGGDNGDDLKPHPTTAPATILGNTADRLKSMGDMMKLPASTMPTLGPK